MAGGVWLLTFLLLQVQRWAVHEAATPQMKVGFSHTLCSLDRGKLLWGQQLTWLLVFGHVLTT